MFPNGKRCPFPVPFLAYPWGSPVKELSQREMLHFQSPPSFIFHSRRYASPLPEPSFQYPSGSPEKEPLHHPSLKVPGK